MPPANVLNLQNTTEISFNHLDSLQSSSGLGLENIQEIYRKLLKNFYENFSLGIFFFFVHLSSGILEISLSLLVRYFIYTLTVYHSTKH